MFDRKKVSKRLAYWGVKNKDDQNEIMDRDKECVFCGATLITYRNGKKKGEVTVDHLDNDGPATVKNVVLCCHHCNCSKGEDSLLEWIERKNISKNKFSDVVEDYLALLSKLNQ